MENEEVIIEEIHNYDHIEPIHNFIDLYNEKMMELDETKSQIKEKDRRIKIKDEYLRLIIDLGYDYDGCNQVASLKDLIDELVGLATKALQNDDKSVMNISTTERNILGEVVKEVKKDA